MSRHKRADQRAGHSNRAARPPRWVREDADHPADAAVLDRLERFKSLHSQLVAEWSVRPFLPGSKGQPIANPAFNQAAALEKAIAALEERFAVPPQGPGADRGAER